MNWLFYANTLKLYFTMPGMDDLKRMAVFAAVVQHGSLTAAARALDKCLPLYMDWQHSGTGESFTVQAMPQVVSNHQGAVQQWCEAGLGVALLSALDAAASVRSGRLLRLLPQWNMGQLDIWAVTPQRDALPAKVRQVIQELQAYFGTI